MKKLFVWTSTPNCNFLLLGMKSRRPSTKRMQKARCVIIGELPFWMNSLATEKQCSPPSHGVNWEQHEHSCLATHSPLLYPYHTPGCAPPKLGSSFCRTLYYAHLFWTFSLCKHMLYPVLNKGLLHRHWPSRIINTTCIFQMHIKLFLNKTGQGIHYAIFTLKNYTNW
jgi:hypothetical protein